MPILPLPRTSLASIVCPSTPFLAPRLLRTPAFLASVPSRYSTPHGVRHSSTSTEPQIRKTWSIAKHKRAAVYKNGKDGYREGQREGKWKSAHAERDLLRQQLRDACQAVALKPVLDLYPGLVALGALTSKDTMRIAQALHVRVRNMRLADVGMEDILVFMQRLISDIQSGVLPPHPYAHVHLLGIYKECEKYQEGFAFWQWLVDKDETFTTQAVYGAAIELMAYGGILPPSELEDLFVDALKRFPGTFAEYHLSPNAVVPDRSQPVTMADIPMLLLQGILTARVLAGDWRNAYLALDTALRLFPAQVPKRFFELFMTHRPLSEAYTAFLVACRTGVLFKPSHLTGLMKQIRMGLVNATLRERLTALRAAANATYAYLEAGGTLQPVHVSSFLRFFEVVYPLGRPGEDYVEEDAQIRNTLVTAAHEVVSTLIQAGMPPQTEAFTALIHLSGMFQVPNLLQVCLQDIETARLELGEVHLRIIIEAAGRLRNKEIVQKYWTLLVSNAEKEGKPADYSDWMTLVRACSRGGFTDYFKEQLWEYDHALSNALKLRLTYHAETQERTRGSPKKDMDLAAFDAEMGALRDQVRNIVAVVMCGQPLDLRKTPFYMSLDPRREPLGSLENLRTVYDELSTDPHQPVPPSASPALSPTGIPLDELRFQNWVSVLEMMGEARALDDNDRLPRGDPKKKATVPFGRPALDGLPLDLESLRTMIKNLRSGSFRKVENDFVRIKKFHTADSQSAQNSKPSLLTGRPMQASRNPSCDSAVEGLAKSPSLRYYLSLESDHEAPAKLLNNKGREPREPSELSTSQNPPTVQSSADWTELPESTPDTNSSAS